MFPPAEDSSIRETDNDAALARLSAVQKHYLEDPYIRHLVPRAHLAQPRSPLINIGTYVRTSALDVLIFQWLQSSQRSAQKCQIVSLGAGSDTRFWRIVVSLMNHFPRKLDDPRSAAGKFFGREFENLR